MEKYGQNIFYGFKSRKMGLLKNYYLKTLCSVRAFELHNRQWDWGTAGFFRSL